MIWKMLSLAIQKYFLHAIENYSKKKINFTEKIFVGKLFCKNLFQCKSQLKLITP